MTGCVTGSSDDLMRRLDAAVASLVPATATLLASVGRGEVVTSRDDGWHALSVPVVFPDGIGEGRVTARVFRYRTGIRVDIALEHNRVIALGDGRPTNRPCFLNDFVASVTLGPDDTALPEKYVAQVEAGVRSALTAVDEHNRRYPKPWNRIRVAAVEPARAGSTR